ncbi:hypothetical protein MTO96_005769 [Rhipicephalus appendiculatus]
MEAISLTEASAHSSSDRVLLPLIRRRRCEAPSGGMEEFGVTTAGSGDALPLIGRGRHRRRKSGLVDPLLPTHQLPGESKAITGTTDAS